jgi:hypothetical protein
MIERREQGLEFGEQTSCVKMDTLCQWEGRRREKEAGRLREVLLEQRK